MLKAYSSSNGTLQTESKVIAREYTLLMKCMMQLLVLIGVSPIQKP